MEITMVGFAGILDRLESLTADQLMAMTSDFNNPSEERVNFAQPGWVDSQGCVGLVGLSKSSKGQLEGPIKSGTGRYFILLDGYIYPTDRSRHDDHSNKEDMAGAGLFLEVVEQSGVGEALKAFDGAFSFALWDVHDKSVYLARDRLGQKGVFYSWYGERLFFGSDLMALAQGSPLTARVDRDALSLFFRYGYFPYPNTIYKDVKKLPPGCFIAFGLSRRESLPVSYWSLRDVALHGQMQPNGASEEEARCHIDSLLVDVLKDSKPYGINSIYLSGDLASSALAAYACSATIKMPSTFSVVLADEEDVDSKKAKDIAAILGTEHTEMHLTQEDVIQSLDSLINCMSEPCADISNMRLYLASKWKAFPKYTSIVGPQGGAELFRVRDQYRSLSLSWGKLNFWPTGVKGFVAGALTIIPPRVWRNMLRVLFFMMPARLRYAAPDERVNNVCLWLRAKSLEDLYLNALSLWKTPIRLIKKSQEPSSLLTSRDRWAELRDFGLRMMFYDLSSISDSNLYLWDISTRKAEVSVLQPFLDHRVVEYLWGLPSHSKIRDEQESCLIKQLMAKGISPQFIGHGKPESEMDVWLRGPLKEWSEQLLNIKEIKKQGFLNGSLIQEKWEQHQSGHQNWGSELWAVIVFQAWLKARGSQLV